MKVSEILIAARKVIESEPAWSQGAYARRADGSVTVTIVDGQAVKFDSIAAINRALGTAPDFRTEGAVKGHLARAIAFLTNLSEFKTMTDTIVEFNDSPNTKHGDVIAAFGLAIENAQKEEA